MIKYTIDERRCAHNTVYILKRSPGRMSSSSESRKACLLGTILMVAVAARKFSNHFYLVFVLHSYLYQPEHFLRYLAGSYVVIQFCPGCAAIGNLTNIDSIVLVVLKLSHLLQELHNTYQNSLYSFLKDQGKYFMGDNQQSLTGSSAQNASRH